MSWIRCVVSALGSHSESSDPNPLMANSYAASRTVLTIILRLSGRLLVFEASNVMESRDTNTEMLTEAQFMRLFVQHEPILRCVARSMLSDWMAVDDVLQEAGVTMWEKIGQLDNADGFLPWAKVIVRLKCHSFINASRRSRLVLCEDAIKLLAVEVDGIDRQTYEANLKALRSCLRRLPQHQQDLVLAPYRDGEYVQSIAAQVGKSANALYKQLGRLRTKLSDCVQNSLRSEAAPGGMAP